MAETFMRGLLADVQCCADLGPRRALLATDRYHLRDPLSDHDFQSVQAVEDKQLPHSAVGGCILDDL